MNNTFKYLTGRNGMDKLNIFLIKLYIVILISNFFLKLYIFGISELLLFIIIIFRIFSKNISKREHENRTYLNIVNKILRPFKKDLKNIHDDEDLYVYKKCHKCKKTLRLPLPSKKGIKKVKCPKCKHINKFLILKEEKIEIIKSGRRDK